MKTLGQSRSTEFLAMERTNGAFIAKSFITAFIIVFTTILATVSVGFSANAKPDRAAFRAAAVACGLPRPGEGKPTEEQETCMTKAGFPRPERPDGDPHRGPHRAYRPDSGDEAPPESRLPDDLGSTSGSTGATSQ